MEELIELHAFVVNLAPNAGTSAVASKDEKSMPAKPFNECCPDEAR
jgi:hypothetical protein